MAGFGWVWLGLAGFRWVSLGLVGFSAWGLVDLGPMVRRYARRSGALAGRLVVSGVRGGVGAKSAENYWEGQPYMCWRFHFSWIAYEGPKVASSLAGHRAAHPFHQGGWNVLWAIAVGDSSLPTTTGKALHRANGKRHGRRMQHVDCFKRTGPRARARGRRRGEGRGHSDPGSSTSQRRTDNRLF